MNKKKEYIKKKPIVNFVAKWANKRKTDIYSTNYSFRLMDCIAERLSSNYTN